MPKLIQSLLSQRAASLLVIVVLVLVIYFAGNLSGFEWVHLHIAAGSALVLCLGFLVLQQQRAAKDAGALESALKAQGSTQLGGTRPDQRADLESLKSQFDESLELLRGSKMGRGALHSIPWFMLIGPPGSGKSTLLRQSGLSFPYMTKGRSAIRGLGGTKNCDWWFADRGILLDTAGRYMTETEDRDEWMSFLRLLKKGRKRRPVNGAIVAIGMAELVESSEAELQAYTENIRDRIDELTRELQTVFPIYVVFTKCDRLRGFVETFDTLNKEQRKQVWGFTFPFKRGKDFVVADQFGKEFDDLYRALCVRRIDLLASDHFKKRKAQLYAFPLQFLRVKERLQSFLSQLQQDNPYQEVSPIRGVYFTSGTQEGTTIDRILKVLRPAELEHDVPEDSRRCYFVDDLFNKVVFEDAALATPSAKSAQREKWLRIAAMAALGVGAIATVVFDWGTRTAFGADCDRIAATVLDKNENDPVKLRASLDAQLRMLESNNHHLKRGDVLGHLEVHYRRSLQSYANERLGRHVETQATAALSRLPAEGEAPPVDPVQKQQRFRLAEDADKELRRIEQGIDGFRGRKPENKDSALVLWKAAVDDTELGLRHFDRLFAAVDLELLIPAAAVALKNARERLQSLLSKEQLVDLREAKALTLSTLFPGAWKSLKEGTTRFGDCTNVVARSWNVKALNLEVKGPLFSVLSAKASSLHLEQFFAELDAEVKKASELVGGSSRQPLKDLLGSGWVEHVEAQHAELLRVLAQDFDTNWGKLLVGLAGLAKQGEEITGTTDSEGSKRLAVVPDLVWAYKVASEVLAQRRAVSEDRKKELLAQLEPIKGLQLPTEGDFAKRPGKPRPEATLVQIVERAKIAAAWLGDEQERIKGVNWGVPPQKNQFFELEISLVEAIANREWAACRIEVEQHAQGQVFPLWDRVQSGFPFALDAADEADASELGVAIKAMAELAATVQQMEPKAAFTPHPEFLADAAAASELCEILYAGKQVQPSPNLEVTLELQKEGAAIGMVRLESESRRTEVGRTTEWPLQTTESLNLTIELVDGQGVTLSIKDLIDVRRQQVPANLMNGTRLVPGLWSLKRLFAMGVVQPGGEREWVSSLQLQGRTDKVLLIVQGRRPEAAKVFDANWPGDRYNLSRKIWQGR